MMNLGYIQNVLNKQENSIFLLSTSHHSACPFLGRKNVLTEVGGVNHAYQKSFRQFFFGWIQPLKFQQQKV